MCRERVDCELFIDFVCQLSAVRYQVDLSRLTDRGLSLLFGNDNLDFVDSKEFFVFERVRLSFCYLTCKLRGGY